MCKIFCTNEENSREKECAAAAAAAASNKQGNRFDENAEYTVD